MLYLSETQTLIDKKEPGAGGKKGKTNYLQFKTSVLLNAPWGREVNKQQMVLFIRDRYSGSFFLSFFSGT